MGNFVLFNRTLPRKGGYISQPSYDEVKITPQLFNASLEDALLYGGDLTRAALGAMEIQGDYDHIIVDTKVHMLMPGMFPAIPGWHTDGVPRGESRDPSKKGAPDIGAQENLRSPRFHLLVTGEHALTVFDWFRTRELDTPLYPNPDLYSRITRQMQPLEGTDMADVFFREVESCTAYEWDWWNLHTATAARAFEWRFLIRVTETDYRPPQKDLRQVLRTQSNVYVPTEQYGW